MLARLRKNWTYKVAAVLIAVALRFYVVAQLNPHTSMTIPIRVVGLPPNLMLQAAVGSVRVDLSGPSVDLDTLRQSDIVAEIDLSNQHAGRSPLLPINVSLNTDLPPEKRSEIQIDSKTPPLVEVTLDPLVTVRKIVRVNVAQPPPEGYMFGAAQVSPSIVEVQSRQELVDQTAAVTVDVTVPEDSSGINPLPITGEFYVTPRDAAGKALDNVIVNPATVRVTVPLVKAALTKVVPVAPTLIGSPALTARIADASVQPASVTLSGAPAALAKVSVVMTHPVDVTGASVDVNQSVQLLIPQGLTAVGSVMVRVHVSIEKVAAPAPVGSGTPAPVGSGPPAAPAGPINAPAPKVPG